MMDQQAAAMLREVESLQGGMLSRLPRGASGYSFVSTMSGTGVCTRSVRITYNGGNAPPKMVSSSSGDCGSDHLQQAPSEVTVPAGPTTPSPGTVEVKQRAARPCGRLPYPLEVTITGSATYPADTPLIFSDTP